VQTAAVILCRDCGNNKLKSKLGVKMAGEPDEIIEEESDEELEAAPSPDEMKAIAGKLLDVMSTESAHSSKFLAGKAGVPYTDYIVPILKKLESVGRVERIDNGWWRRKG
jgi:hypothetical protein